ncbi:MAG: hypothetical protein ACOZAN_03275 [Patescibacteria group bacterium]
MSDHKRNGSNSHPLLMILLSVYFLWAIFYLLLNVNQSNFKLLFFSVLLYLLSHVFRAARIWLLMGVRGVGLKNIIFFQFVSASFGNVTLPLIKDFGLVALVSSYCKSCLLKTIAVMIYIRFFDLIILLPPLFLQAVTGSTSTLRANSTISLLLGVFIWFGIVLLPKILSIFLIYMVGKKHSSLSYYLVLAISHLQKIFKEIGINSAEKIFLMLSLTVLGWVTELYAVMTITSTGIDQAYPFVLDNVINNFGLQYNNQYSSIYYAFVFICFCILIVFFTRNIQKLNRHEHNLHN